jgi:CheY-like chemotaxis protein
MRTAYAIRQTLDKLAKVTGYRRMNLQCPELQRRGLLSEVSFRSCLMSARILVVDDNPLNLALASYILKSVGYVVEEAVDADDAQKLLKETMPDLILVDIGLPGMDGLTLTRQLKADERLKDIPIVALTASAIQEDEQKALLAGCVGYITKPINMGQFSQQVAAFLHQAATVST